MAKINWRRAGKAAGYALGASAGGALIGYMSYRARQKAEAAARKEKELEGKAHEEYRRNYTRKHVRKIASANRESTGHVEPISNDTVAAIQKEADRRWNMSPPRSPKREKYIAKVRPLVFGDD